ncbi:hypothetical protein BOW50_12350 [Solemya velum gill symbiont]|uniref:hypothetical protein n=1 Tax=Solemya velum gill symbiont TaxID=2340 RepID=UPI0009978104|nr:hypothetical protein [Solemya velum gill symbiont]OOZ74853.1 hypothetical protein BOW50_12350 [Solemya velum gill symbiont]
MRDKFQSAFQFDNELAWKIFDHLVSGLSSDSGVAAKSSIGEKMVGGGVVQRSRRTYDHAINGAIGEATQGLLHAIGTLKLDENQGIPEVFKSRIEVLLAVPSDGGDHAVAILANHVNWLYYRDPDWVMKRIVPWFDLENNSCEPAWSGFLSRANPPYKELRTVLKPFLLRLFPEIYSWSWGDELARIAAQIVVGLTVYRDDSHGGLTDKEARQCLRNMKDENRQDAIFHLGQIGQQEEDGWSICVIPFVRNVWPRERKYRTSTLVRSWVTLLDDTGENFPAVLNVVHKLLVPVEGENHWLYRFSKDGANEQSLTSQYPEHVLELLDAVIPNSPEYVPYEMAQVLNLIEETDSSLVRDRRFQRLTYLIEQT